MLRLVTTAACAALALVTTGCGMARYQIGDDVVLDTAMNLVWQRTADLTPVPLATAKAYCAKLELHEVNGWRLPKESEVKGFGLVATPDDVTSSRQQDFDIDAFPQLDPDHVAWATTNGGDWAIYRGSGWHSGYYFCSSGGDGVDGDDRCMETGYDGGWDLDPGMDVNGDHRLTPDDHFTTRCVAPTDQSPRFGHY